jgi:N-acyl amino acid synthase of PEP-CTERM/exosortase system
MGFEARTLDDDPVLLEQSYRLRYQVYCMERRFLPAGDYPDQREWDEFDADSIHVGAVYAGTLAATARVVKPGRAGLPLFRHCTLFPNETALDEAGRTMVEVSRVSISRHYARRPDDTVWSGIAVPGAGARAAPPGGQDRRKRTGEPFLTLLRAVIYASKRAGATHLIGATDAALHRWLVHYGFPYRLAGPEVDYYGRVAPHIMSLAELDQVIVGGRFPSLHNFPVGMDPERWPKPDEPAEAVAPGHVAGPPAPADRPVEQ